MLKRILFIGALMTALVGNGLILQAADVAESKATEVSRSEAKRKQMPLRGKLTAVDLTDRTITLRGKEKPRIFKVADLAKIQREAKPITLSDLQVGEMIGGLARQNAGGVWEVVTLNITTKTAGKASLAGAEADE
jgi:hypothetical protein